MTGPNPDAELDEALGVDQLPPAAVTDQHTYRAMDALFPALSGVLTADEVDEMEPAARNQVRRTAQEIADAEQRGAARVLAEHAIAGTPVVDDELVGVPGAENPRLELANIRRLCQRHGTAPADGLGVIRSTVAMVEEALISRPPIVRPGEQTATRPGAAPPTPTR